MKTRVIFWGAGGHAAVCSELIRVSGHYELAGCLSDPGHEPSVHPALLNFKLEGPEQLKIIRQSGVRHAFVSVGDCAIRLEKGRLLAAAGFELISLVHPSAIISSSATLGAGTAVMAGVVVNAHAKIGGQVILNTACSVDHDCQLADGVHISPGARLAGRVNVGRAAWVGIGASVRDGVNIGAGSIVGVGAAVIKDVPDKTVVAGVPARTIKQIYDDRQ